MTPTRACDCPPPVPLQDLLILPVHRTPIDKLGFPVQFCCCCTPRTASGFICFVVLFWTTLLLQCADKTTQYIFPDREIAFKAFKTVYILLCLGMIISACGLLLGVVIRRYHTVHCFVWYGFMFNILILLIVIVSTTVKSTNAGDVLVKDIIKLIIAVVWSIVFLYLLMVVNSYKLLVWYRTLGFAV